MRILPTTGHKYNSFPFLINRKRPFIFLPFLPLLFYLFHLYVFYLLGRLVKIGGFICSGLRGWAHVRVIRCKLKGGFSSLFPVLLFSPPLMPKMFLLYSQIPGSSSMPSHLHGTTVNWPKHIHIKWPKNIHFFLVDQKGKSDEWENAAMFSHKWSICKNADMPN